MANSSPQWKFDDATFDRSAAAFDNPDHVSVVVHNYRWRLGLKDSDPEYDDLEKQLAQFSVITVPMPRNFLATTSTGPLKVA
jgi:hypothetical protein